MKKKLIILSSLIILVVIACILIIQLNKLSESNREQNRSMQRILYTMAKVFEATDIPPPNNGIQMLEGKIDHWGTPIQYSYENGIPTLRAAGKDKKLNTKDDITQELHNQGMDPTESGS